MSASTYQMAPSAPEAKCACYWCGESKEAVAMIGKTIKVGKKKQFHKFCDDGCFEEWKTFNAPKVQIPRAPARRFSSWGFR